MDQSIVSAEHIRVQNEHVYATKFISGQCQQQHSCYDLVFPASRTTQLRPLLEQDDCCGIDRCAIRTGLETTVKQIELDGTSRVTQQREAACAVLVWMMSCLQHRLHLQDHRLLFI